ncbi:MAG TPA: hypothetical protein VKM93_26810 [Terriglobia bacterium]|nr:hypothetical protein [Terriglobia bacterium]
MPVETDLAALKPIEFAERASTCVVLHLHGSFCVYTSEFDIKRNPGDEMEWLNQLDRPRYSFDPDSITSCFPPYRPATSRTGRVSIEERVIAPIPDKADALKLPFISETYRKACSLVRESGVLVAVGYSFNNHDRPSYEPILHALDKSRERTLIIVSPQARKLADKIGAEYRTLRVRPINKTFKGWAEDSFRYRLG